MRRNIQALATFLIFLLMLNSCTKDNTNPCVNEQIHIIKKQGSSAHISEFDYKAQKVYYVFIDGCCDGLNMLYDANCNILCESGGIFGLSCPDSIVNNLLNEKIIFTCP